MKKICPDCNKILHRIFPKEKHKWYICKYCGETFEAIDVERLDRKLVYSIIAKILASVTNDLAKIAEDINQPEMEVKFKNLEKQFLTIGKLHAYCSRRVK